MAGKERVSGVSATIELEIISELFRELEPGGARIGLFGVLLIGVGSAPGGSDGGGDDGEDGVGHAGAFEGLLAGVVAQVGQGVGGGVVCFEIEGEGVEDDVGLFYGDGAVHAGVFFDDSRVAVAGDEDVGGDVGEGFIWGLAKHGAEDISVC